MIAMRPLYRLRQLLNALALPLWGVGSLVIVGRALRQWRRDVERREQVRSQDSSATLTATADRTLPRVSLLVAAWNEEALIARHIDAFQQLRYADKHLVVCAGGPDHTFERALAAAGGDEAIRVLQQLPGEGKQRALRRSLAHADGALIFLTDADCLVTDEALEKTLAPLIDGHAQASTGASRPLEEQLSRPFVQFQWAVDHYAYLYGAAESSGMLGRNCAVTRSALIASGGFETDAASGTDYTLARQLIAQGETIHNVPTSFVQTEYPTRLADYYHKRLRWLRNLLVLGYQYRDRATFQQGLITSSTGIIILVMPLAAFLFGPIVLVSWLLLVTQAITSRLRYIWLVPDMTPRTRVAASTVGVWVLAVDVVSWAAALIQALLPRLRTRWR